MRVALDAQLAVGTSTGIGEYVRGLIDALRERGVDVVALREPRLDPWRFDRRVLWDQVLLPSAAARAKASLLHCSSGTMPLVRALPVVTTVHDLAWQRTQRHARWYARAYFGGLSLRQYRHAAAILTDSAFSRRELLDVAGAIDAARVHVVYPGVAAEFAALSRRPDGRTILVVGTVEPRKNLAFIIARLRALPLARVVSVGPSTPYHAECRDLARRLGVGDRVEFRGYVTERELLSLYESAAVAAVPSTYEGFGYAVAQALCAGLPCVASDRASLPEVSGGDAVVLPLADESAWEDALAGALRGERDAAASDARARSAERFSWRSAARAVADVYRAAMGQ